MTIRHELTESVRTTPALAFAAIDDLPLAARWLPPCVSLTKVGTGPNAVGDKLKYVYKQGGKTASMDGEIVDRMPGRRLRCRYVDKLFEVSVDLSVAASPAGTEMTHVIEIMPKTLLFKLMSPLIRLGVKKQTRDAAANLKRLLEERA